MHGAGAAAAMLGRAIDSQFHTRPSGRTSTPASGLPLEAYRVMLEEDGSKPTSGGNSTASLKTSTAAAAPASSADEAAGGLSVPRALAVDCRCEQLVLMIRNSLRVPIAEVGAQELQLGISTSVPGINRAFMFLTASVNTYNPLLAVWEPMLEPWQLLSHLDHSQHAKVTSGRRGGGGRGGGGRGGGAKRGRGRSAHQETSFFEG
jgi:hypothetical protein